MPSSVRPASMQTTPTKPWYNLGYNSFVYLVLSYLAARKGITAGLGGQERKGRIKGRRHATRTWRKPLGRVQWLEPSNHCQNSSTFIARGVLDGQCKRKSSLPSQPIVVAPEAAGLGHLLGVELASSASSSSTRSSGLPTTTRCTQPRRLGRRRPP